MNITTVEEWLFNPPIFQSEDDALEIGAKIVREMDTTQKNEWLAMMMLWWASHKYKHEFKALFYEFDRLPTGHR